MIGRIPLLPYCKACRQREIVHISTITVCGTRSMPECAPSFFLVRLSIRSRARLPGTMLLSLKTEPATGSVPAGAAQGHCTRALSALKPTLHWAHNSSWAAVAKLPSAKQGFLVTSATIQAAKAVRHKGPATGNDVHMWILVSRCVCENAHTGI